MDFELVIKSVIKDFKEYKINYALIGGYAFGLWGVSRNTFDLDFLIDKKYRNELKNILAKYYYDVKYETENVAQFISDLKPFGEIDVIYAFRKISLEMLGRALEETVFEEIKIKVLLPEDLIGLKLQAIKNDPDRYHSDLLDIKELIIVNKNRIDEGLLKRYFELFDSMEIYYKLFMDAGC
ncbi:MAG: nucleotidyltransferase [Spirochaetota bacterium]